MSASMNNCCVQINDVPFQQEEQHKFVVKYICTICRTITYRCEICVKSKYYYSKIYGNNCQSMNVGLIVHLAREHWIDRDAFDSYGSILIKAPTDSIYSRYVNVISINDPVFEYAIFLTCDRNELMKKLHSKTGVIDITLENQLEARIDCKDILLSCLYICILCGEFYDVPPSKEVCLHHVKNCPFTNSHRKSEINAL